jgi:hypothetical protein
VSAYEDELQRMQQAADSAANEYYGDGVYEDLNARLDALESVFVEGADGYDQQGYEQDCNWTQEDPAPDVSGLTEIAAHRKARHPAGLPRLPAPELPPPALREDFSGVQMPRCSVRRAGETRVCG